MKKFISIVFFVCFTTSSQHAFSQQVLFNLVEEDLVIFDQEESHLIDEESARFKREHLREFFMNEISGELLEQGLDWFNKDEEDISSMFTNLLSKFSDSEGEYFYYRRIVD